MPRLLQGDKMPNFTVNTATKSGTSIEELVGGKPTMFMVLRYIGCTVCIYDVHLLSQRYSEFTDKGVNVVVLMQSPTSTVLRDLKGNTLPFELICDDTLQMYKALEINPAADMAALIGDKMPEFKIKVAAAKEAGFEHGDYEGIEEQLPAFFFVNPDLTVKEAHYASNIMDMPTVAEMLAKI